jgi:hypothetical protein
MDGFVLNFLAEQRSRHQRLLDQLKREIRAVRRSGNTVQTVEIVRPVEKWNQTVRGQKPVQRLRYEDKSGQ